MNTQLQPSLETEIAVPQIAVLPPPPAGAETRASKPKARNGKIARLPYPERDMVNRMLRNNIPHSNIVGALDEHNIRVTERNVSNWKTRGGYQEWCAEQDRALEIRLLQDNLTDYLRKNDASQLPEVGLQLAATRLSQFLLTPEAQQQLAADPKAYARTVATLCRLSGQIHHLQKYRDDSAKALGRDPEHIKRETEAEIEVTRNVYSAAKLAQSARESDIPHHNYLPKP